MQDRVLKPALLALFQNGPDKIDYGDKDADRKAERFVKHFDRVVDATFFDDLWREVDQEGRHAQNRERIAWVRGLLRSADIVLHDAESSASRSSHRRFRASVRAADRLRGAAYHNQQLQPYLEEVRRHDTE